MNLSVADEPRGEPVLIVHGPAGSKARLAEQQQHTPPRAAP
jgi:hypothetical protein